MQRDLAIEHLEPPFGDGHGRGPLFDAAGRSSGHGLPPSFPEHVRQVLEREIIEGRLIPGERVTEQSLARRIGVSRTPVREAMHLLEGQGLIVRRRGRGTYVAERTTADEAKALYELRVPLESYLAGRAAVTISRRELGVLRSVHEEFRSVVDAAGEQVELRRLVGLDSDFHWLIYRVAGSDLASIIASYWGRLLRELYDRVYTSERPTTFAAQHDSIIRAFEARDPEAAVAAMDQHITSGWEAIRASYDASDEPSGERE